jgi:hypothetical protein
LPIHVIKDDLKVFLIRRFLGYQVHPNVAAASCAAFKSLGFR